VSGLGEWGCGVGWVGWNSVCACVGGGGGDLSSSECCGRVVLFKIYFCRVNPLTTLGFTPGLTLWGSVVK